MAEKMFVRLKPYDPKSGHLLRRFCLEGKIFDVEKGWYSVPRGLALKLKQVQQTTPAKAEVRGNEPLAFDVVETAEQAKQIERAEKQEARRKNAVFRASDLSGEGGDEMSADDIDAKLAAFRQEIMGEVEAKQAEIDEQAEENARERAALKALRLELEAKAKAVEESAAKAAQAPADAPSKGKGADPKPTKEAAAEAGEEGKDGDDEEDVDPLS